jgi:phospholipid transport system substrate-binding protein
MMKKLSSIFILCLFWLSSPATAENTAMEASVQQASDYAESVSNQAMAVLKEDISAEEKQAKLTEQFLKEVDADWIGKFVLGVHWRRLKEEQREEYLTHYRDFLISQYTSNFQEYADGASFTLLNARPIGKKGNQFLVSSKVQAGSGQPVQVDYRIRRNDDNSFHVIDIVVEGVSLLATQRSEFASVIQRQGIDFLIQRLKQKSQQNSAG